MEEAEGLLERPIAGGPVRPAVLVIDDDPVTLGYLRRLLEAEGCAVEVAADAAEGVRKAREGAFGVVLLDYLLPNQSGLETLQELRRAAPDSPVLVISGFGAVEVAEAAFKHGAAGFLAKPVEPRVLVAEVRKVLGRRG